MERCDDMGKQAAAFLRLWFVLLFAYVLGSSMQVAGGGRVALDMALATHPDVIIMDLAMPGMDGFEATRRIKELKATRHVPVIALSAYGEMPVEWARDAGCETYLRKPILPQELSEQIEQVIARAKRRQVPRTR